MVITSKIVLPVVLGISLLGVSSVLLYILLKKDEEEVEINNVQTESSKYCSKDVPIAKEYAAIVIGRGGNNIKDLEQKSGARMSVSDVIDGSDDRVCTIRGTQIAVSMAENLLQEVIHQQKTMETVNINIPHWATGKIIGRGGENINKISHVSGAKLTIKANKDNKDSASQKQVLIKGNSLQIKIATDMIEKCVAEDKREREAEVKNREPRGKHSSNIGVIAVGGDPGTKGSCPQNAPPAGSSGALLEVFVSAISSPSRFWLQIVGPQVEELDKLVCVMTEYYSNVDNRELHQLSDVLVGQMVAAVFRHDGKWYRAKVMEIKPNEFDETSQVCDVHFVDYGDNEYVAKNELLSLRTDMLQLRFQAVECFLAGVAPGPTSEKHDESHIKWDNQAIERFEDLTQVARWKRLWSRTCTFKERPKPETVEVDESKRNTREGSPIPGVKLYDTRQGKDIDIGKILMDEGWAIEVSNEQTPYKLSNITTPAPPTPVLPPPTFGDLECSRVLGMVTGNREERASSLPHGKPSPSTSPHLDRASPGDNPFQSISDDVKPKSISLAAGMDNNVNNQSYKSSSPTPSAISDLSYSKPEVNGAQHMNGSSPSSKQKNVHNGDFLNAERNAANGSTPSTSPKKEESHKPKDAPVKPPPLHIPDPKDELKAKMNRVDSHHGSLETMGTHIPPLSIINPPGSPKPVDDNH